MADDILNVMKRRLSSGNSVPVESTRITSEEWEQVEDHLESLDAEVLNWRRRALDAERNLAKSEERVQKFRRFILETPAGTGVCCCGDDMEGHPHPLHCGHTPRDEWDWAVECMLRDIDEHEKHEWLEE